MAIVFECKQCGACCRKGWGIPPEEHDRIATQRALASEEECLRICEHMGWTLDDLARIADCKPRDGFETVRTGKCYFLTDDNRCGIHGIKPRGCADWPHNYALCTTERGLAKAKAKCPGIDPSSTPLNPRDVRGTREWYAARRHWWQRAALRIRGLLFGCL